MNIKAVIFDMDGTLLDTQKICIPAWEAAGLLQGIKNMGAANYNVCGMNELGWTSYLKTNFPTLDIDKFKKDFRQYIQDNLKVTFKPGAKALLDYLKAKGIPIGLASGTSMPSVLHHLKEVNAIDYFNVIVGGKDVENGKPAPDIFLLAAKRLGVPPEECIVFEDSKNGVLSAVAAGCSCIGVPDVVPFTDDVKAILYSELTSIDEAIELLEPII